MPSSIQNPRFGRFRRVVGGIVILGAVAVAGSIATGHYFHAAQATATAAAAEQAVPVTVAVVQPRPTTLFEEFSGRLEAVDRVQLRPRVAGAILATNFTEGALVKAGDVLFKIDPAPYAAEVDDKERYPVEARDALVRAGFQAIHSQRFAVAKAPDKMLWTFRIVFAVVTRAQNLQRADATERGLFRAIDFSHSTARNLFQQIVITKPQ